MKLFDLVDCQFGIFFAVEFSDVEKIVICFFWGVFGDHADGCVFEEDYENDADEYQRDGEEEYEDCFEVGDEEIEEYVEEGSDVEHGRYQNFKFLSFVFLNHLGYKNVSQIEGKYDSCCQHQHACNSHPDLPTEG